MKMISFRVLSKIKSSGRIYNTLKYWKQQQQTNFYGTQSETFAVTYKEFGDPREVLEGSVIRLPETLGPGDAYIRMLAAPINPADINTIEGTYPTKPSLPTIVGNEGVGEVLEVGPEVKTLKPGDWVISDTPGWGTWREYAVCPASEFRQISNTIPVISAATISVNPCTAYRMLSDFVELKEGDTVVQNGANSVAGQSVIQLAAAWKINTINIVRDRPEIDDLKTDLTNLGATHVVTQEFCRTPAMKELMKSVQRPKLALNCVGGRNATELIRMLDRKGVMVTFGGMSKQPITVPTGVMIFNEVRLAGYWMTDWVKNNQNSPEREKMLDNLCSLIKDDKLRPPPYTLTPIREFKTAIETALGSFSGRKQILDIHQPNS